MRNVPLMSFRNVWKIYKSKGSDVILLKDINLEIYDGEIVSVLGKSGSGKTTLLRIAAGLIPPSQGAVFYRGREVRGINQNISFVFADFALIPWLSVLGNVEIVLRGICSDKKERKKRASEALDIVGLDGFEDAYPHELSSGMQQRVGIARALVTEPDILLMDEPFSEIDVLTAENLRKDLLKLWTEDKIPTRAILLVTHNIEEAVYLSDRVIILSHNPASIKYETKINLPHQRMRDSKDFLQVVDQLYIILTEKTEDERLRDEKIKQQHPLPIQRLPKARIGAIIGFVQLVNEFGKIDIYKIGDELSMEIDDLLPAMEAAEIFNFIKVEKGDVEITDYGKKFAEASVLDRKKMFREILPTKIDFVKFILKTLAAKRDGRMTSDFFLGILERHFTEGEAEDQFRTIIDWARYAELFTLQEDEFILDDGGKEILKQLNSLNTN